MYNYTCSDFRFTDFYETQQSAKIQKDAEDTVFNHASVNFLDFRKVVMVRGLNITYTVVNTHLTPFFPKNVN